MPVPNPSGDVYYTLLDSIVSQQLSVKVANTIFNRFLTLFEGGYPHAHQLLNKNVEELRAVGLSYQKANYLKNVAEFFIAENAENKDWEAMSDEEIIKFLTAIKGVGRWTVEMILMFTLLRPDVFPTDDLGIQQGMIRLYGLENDKLLKKRMIEIASQWQPFRTLASKYIWRAKDEAKI